MRKPGLLSLALCLASAFAVGPGCARGGTGTGNPGLRIVSRGYNTALARSPLLELAIPSAMAATTSITSLRICVTQLKFYLDGGGELSVPRSDLGLVDLGNGSGLTTWGVLTVTPGTVVRRIHVEIHHDSETCSGVGFSIEANGQSVTKDLELHFELASPFAVPTSGSVTFSLANLAAKIDQALAAGEFDDSHIENYIDEELEDEAEGYDD